jgi:hypothetical protein
MWRARHELRLAAPLISTTHYCVDEPVRFVHECGITANQLAVE